MNRLLSIAIAGLVIALAPLSASAQLTPVPLGNSAAPYGYYEYLPFGYDDTLPQEWPVVIFLHGAGKKGNGTTELSKVLEEAMPEEIKTGTNYPFVAISPQTAGSWDNTATTDALVEFVKTNYRVDPDRIYLTGLSLGGRGTWYYAKAHPEKLAAVLPVCGEDTAPNGAKLVNVPTWAFHNWGDGTVPVSRSINWVNAISGALTNEGPTDVMAAYPTALPPTVTKTASYNVATKTWTWKDGVVQGSHPSFTLYPDSGHDSWTKTYRNATAWKWLLAQTRHGATNRAPVVTLSAPVSNQNVTITAQVTDSDGTFGPVEFYAGATRLGTDSASPYQLAWNNAPAGTHWITAKATDDDGATTAAVVKITVQAAVTQQVITPAAAGQAEGSSFFPMSFAFDGQPTGLDASGTPTGGTNGSDAPYYANRAGYIDFGPNWQKVRITATWTKYRVSSGGNQTPYAELWWDDDIDTVNDSGLTETRVNFNSAQNLSTGSQEPWLRDRDLSASPVTPRARYLLCRSPSVMSNRAKEYAFVGWIEP